MTKTSEQTLEEFLGRSPTRMEELYTEALGYPVDLLKPVARKTKRQRLEIKKQKLVNKQLERIKKGRTRGAGAGGFNRDVDNIRHQINLVQTEIDDLKDDE